MVVWRALTEEVLGVVEVVMATVVEADVSVRTVVCDDLKKNLSHCIQMNASTF